MEIVNQAVKKETVTQKLMGILRLDGWANIITGIGTMNSDKKLNAIISWERMSESECGEFFAGSDVARKIVEELPSDSLREGYNVLYDDQSDEEKIEITDEEKRLCLNEKVSEAWTWARAFKGAAIVLITNDLLPMDMPLNEDNIQEISSLLVLNAFELQADQIENDIRHPNFGFPRTYTIAPRDAATDGAKNISTNKVHHTRVIRFDGAKLARIQFQRNGYWGDSIINVCKDAIRDFETAISSIATTLADFSIGVYKINGLHNMIAQDNDDEVIKRMQIVNITRSVARAIVIDAENESFEYQDRTLQGVADCVRLVAGRLVIASNMPHTKLMGESPTGSNATGNSTTTQWYDFVAAQQKNYLEPKLLRLWKLIFLQEKFGREVPAGLKIEQNPLWQQSEDEIAKTRKTQAETDQIYISNGVTDPTTVAKSRFGSGKYSIETTLNGEDKETPFNPVTNPDPTTTAPPPGASGGASPDPKKPDPEKDTNKK